jgi:hypothetical protein
MTRAGGDVQHRPAQLSGPRNARGCPTRTEHRAQATRYLCNSPTPFPAAGGPGYDRFAEAFGHLPEALLVQLARGGAGGVLLGETIVCGRSARSAL